ncbi:hypothetical protein FOTG_14863 [Fusarium oxysporum f. sp. vasinfectum 25433]|uniref:Zonadhesin n=1 Tax=Fusarium oxysporum f. sp. vasinfectum 25433 TaxID=1089449 RepID=X0M8C3_FUSOX|nr:hypothetical protein FOTG_14863 [Fusarium oxysporum f. sp. vasinfectum 25433]
MHCATTAVIFQPEALNCWNCRLEAESPVESTSIESIPSSTLPPESPIGSTRTGTTPTESGPTPTTSTLPGSIPSELIPPESTPPESTPTEPTPTAPTLPESLPSESTPPESIPPESTASETPSIQATNEPPQITEGRTSPPESPQEPTKAASETIGSPDVTQPGITDQGTAIRPTSTSSPAGEIDLQDAVLGPNARFILIGGEPAILLTAPPNGEASFSLNISLPPNITPGELVNLLASIRVEFNGTSMPRARSLFRREMTGSRLQMILDEKSIYDKELKTTGGKFQEVKSEKTSISDQPSIKMVQRSGSNPVALTVRGLSLVKAEKQTAPSEKQTAPAEKQTAPAEKQTAPAEKQTAPVEKPAIPSEKSTIPVERPTVSEEEPTIPAEVTQTEAAQQTARSSGGSKTGGGRESGGFISVSNLETKTVTGPGIPTTSGPIEITPNEGGHNHMINKAVLYILPLLAAIMA